MKLYSILQIAERELNDNQGSKHFKFQITSFRSTFNWRNTSECKNAVFLLYSCGTFFTDLRRLLQEQLTQKNNLSQQILLFTPTFAQIVLNFSPVEGYILLCSGKFRGSGGILTEPRSAPGLAPVPGSEQWTLVSCGPGGSPDQCLSSLSTTLRQSMSQPCLYYHHKQKYTSIKCKKSIYFPVQGDLAASPLVGGGGANILHSPTSILLCT